MVEINGFLTGGLVNVIEKATIIEADTLSQSLTALTNRHGEDFGSRLFDDNGNPRMFINICVDGRDYRFLGSLDAALEPGTELNLIPAVSGG